MSPVNSCRNCKGTQIEYDPTQGNSFCVRCGIVLEENTVVAEVTFAEMADGSSMLQGQFVSAERGKVTAPSIFGRRTDSGDSREWTLFNAKRRLQAVGLALNLGEHHIDQAHRWYTLALQHQFTRGRRSNHIVASCLYIVCRLEKTAHMLLDFSDVLQTSVYVLGGTFLRLVQLLNLQMPIIDPSFYVGRFASKLEFGEACQQVTNTALRVVQSMKRDWIITGRRPAGICAAGILLAARSHGFHRTEREIVRIVHICEATLKRRLSEFEATPSSSLTPEEFESIWLETEADPPSFKKKQHIVTTIDTTIMGTPPMTPLLQEKAPTSNRDDNNFSDFDNDPEVDHVLLSPGEAQTKTAIWTQLNQDYLEKEQIKLAAALEAQERLAAKQAALLQEQKDQQTQEQIQVNEDGLQVVDESNLGSSKKAPATRKKRNNLRPTPLATAVMPVAETAAEAAKKALSAKRFSRKINYEALEDLFSHEKQQ